MLKEPLLFVVRMDAVAKVVPGWMVTLGLTVPDAVEGDARLIVTGKFVFWGLPEESCS